GCVGRMRYANVKATPRYCETLAGGTLPIASWEHLSERQRLAERLILGLRTADGVPAALLETRLEGDGRLRDLVDQWRDRALLADVADRVRLTEAGVLLSDALFVELLSFRHKGCATWGRARRGHPRVRRLDRAGRLAGAGPPALPAPLGGDLAQRHGRPRRDGLPRTAAHERGPRADRQGLSLLRRVLPTAAELEGRPGRGHAAAAPLGDRRLHGADLLAPVGRDEADGPPAGAPAQADHARAG